MKNLITPSEAMFLKSCLIFLLCAVFFNAINYVMIAFVLWKANPAQWSAIVRYYCVVLSFPANVVSGVMAFSKK